MLDYKRLTSVFFLDKILFLALFDNDLVIPLGFEPKTHSLEGCCSNPTELRNHFSKSFYQSFLVCGCKGNTFSWNYQIFWQLFRKNKVLSSKHVFSEMNYFIFARYSAARLSPNSSAFFRFLIASSFMFFSL